MAHMIECKFGMHTTGYCQINPINFDDYGIYSLFTRVQKKILIHYSLWIQIIISMLVSKWCILLSSNLVHVLISIVSILVNVGLKLFLHEQKNISYTLNIK